MWDCKSNLHLSLDKSSLIMIMTKPFPWKYFSSLAALLINLFRIEYKINENYQSQTPPIEIWSYRIIVLMHTILLVPIVFIEFTSSPWFIPTFTTPIHAGLLNRFDLHRNDRQNCYKLAPYWSIFKQPVGIQSFCIHLSHCGTI